MSPPQPGTHGRGFEGHRVGRPVVESGAGDLGDDVTGPAHEHRVTGPDVAAEQVVEVVQGGRGDRDPADHDRFQHGDRGDDAGPADLHLDAQQPGGAGVGGELVGDAPPRCPAGEAGLLPVGGLVGLDDRPVHAEPQHATTGVQRLDGGKHLVDRRAQRHPSRRPGRGRDAEPFQAGHRGGVRDRLPVAAGESVHGVGEKRQRRVVAPVLRAQRPGRRAARVGERRLAVTGPHDLGRSEVGVGHEHLAAHLDGQRLGRRACPVTSSPARPSPRVATSASRPST